MTQSGFESLPNLDEKLKIDLEIKEALKEDNEIWENFNKFPELYQRIRIGNIMRDKKFKREYETSLRRFLEKRKEKKICGDWNDNGRLLK